jgi:hypothetical protein
MDATSRDLLRELARQTIPPEPIDRRLGRRVRIVRRLERFGSVMLRRALGRPSRLSAAAGPLDN